MAKQSPYISNVPITLCGNDYLLRFDYKSIRPLEEQTGKSVFAHLVQLGSGSVSSTFDMLKYGLCVNHPELTDDDVASILDAHDDIPALMNALANAAGNFVNRRQGGKPEAISQKKEETRSDTATDGQTLAD
jgi:hypothetical protein